MNSAPRRKIKKSFVTFSEPPGHRKGLPEFRFASHSYHIQRASASMSQAIKNSFPTVGLSRSVLLSSPNTTFPPPVGVTPTQPPLVESRSPPPALQFASSSFSSSRLGPPSPGSRSCPVAHTCQFPSPVKTASAPSRKNFAITPCVVLLSAYATM